MRYIDFAAALKLIAEIYDKAEELRVICEATLGERDHLTQMARLIKVEAEEAKDLLRLACLSADRPEKEKAA